MTYTLNILSTLINKEGKSGIVTLYLPQAKADASNASASNIVHGCLLGDITLSYGNRFNQVLPSLDALALATNILSGWQGIANWMAATQAAWVGSEPLKVSLSFYMFTFSEKDNIDKQLNNLKALTVPTLLEKGSSIGDYSNDAKKQVDNWSVRAHGGYKPDVLLNNENLAFSNDLSSNYTGTIQVHAGSNCRLKNMLVETVQEERSSVLCKNGKPLYIKVTANLRSSRVLFSEELTSMFA